MFPYLPMLQRPLVRCLVQSAGNNTRGVVDDRRSFARHSPVGVGGRGRGARADADPTVLSAHARLGSGRLVGGSPKEHAKKSILCQGDLKFRGAQLLTGTGVWAAGNLL